MQRSNDLVKQQLLDTILAHVAFDGWSAIAFDAAVDELGLDPVQAKSLCPRGAVDLAILLHETGDAAMVAALEKSDFSDMRYSGKVANAIWTRLQVIQDKEAVRRATTLFALPHMAPDGAKLIWNTADQIWNALEDSSTDVNWYTKRATLSGVYGSVVLYWLGDTSPEHSATREFTDRRIENVMQFEKFKATLRQNTGLKPFTDRLSKMMTAVKAPSKARDADLPGMWRGETD